MIRMLPSTTVSYVITVRPDDTTCAVTKTVFTMNRNTGKSSMNKTNRTLTRLQTFKLLNILDEDE